LDDNLEKYFCIFILAVMVFAIACQVVFRMTGLPLSWTEELARYAYIWLIYISCSYAVKQDRHIKIDAVMLLFKEKGRFILGVISNFLCFIFTVVFSYQGFLMLHRLMFVMKQKSPAMRMPMSLPYAAIFVGFTLMSFRLLQSIVRLIRQHKKENGGANAALTEAKQG
jgi:TRAP-type C4-dicarboxylate transport system permease small subunit